MSLAKIALPLVLPSLLLLPAAPARAEEGVSLRQCYDWAKERSENLKIRREDVLQSEARGRAALGGAHPELSWELTDTWQDPHGVKELERKGFSGFVEKNQIESNFALKQPLFSGLREFSAYKGAKRERARNALLLDRASQELYEKTADAFYAVVGHETDRDNTDTALTLAQDRVKELSSFRRLGKARDSELFTSQARAAALKAELQQIQARIVTAREELSFLTGQNLNAAPLTDDIPNPPAFDTLDNALALARERTDLKAQREDVAAQKLRVRYQKGYYWPTADVTGNYYTQRAAFMDEIDWDVVLSLKVPFYQGGSVSARVREAQSAYRQAQLRLEEMERDAAYNVRSVHGQLAAAVEETRSLEEAADAAQKSYDALRDEYKLGLVTNLDVLQALDFLQEQKTARDAARLRAKRLFIQLNVAVEKAL